MRIVAVLALVACACSAMGVQTPMDTPANECRGILKIVHCFFGDQAADQDRMIRQLKDDGFGGVACNVSQDRYLEDEEKWASFTSWVAKAKKAGLALWLYDESGYPSGTAGGLTLRDHPELAAMGMLTSTATTNGDKASIVVPPGKLLLAAAFRNRGGTIDLASKIDLSANVSGARLDWQPPDGSWAVLVATTSPIHEGTHASIALAERRTYINLLDPAATRRFIEITHDRYAAHIPGKLGDTFVSTFTDEPSLMSLFFNKMDYGVLPWTGNLPAEFKKRRGRELDQLVPLIALDTGSAGKKARYDFWLTVGELVSEGFFGQIQDWCARHGLASGGHLLLEEDIASHVALYGDAMRCLRRMDAPSIDCLTSIPAEVPWRIARLASSAAELDGDTLVMSETSDHCQRYQKNPPIPISEQQIRGTCNRLFCGGVNEITSYYSFAGLSNEQLRRLNTWVARCGSELRGGRQVTDIAVLYPIESVWPDYVPASHWTPPAVGRVRDTFSTVSDTLFVDRRDFTYIDSRTLAEAKVAGDTLRYNGLEWRVLVLPAVDTLPLAAWQNVRRFWLAGGAVVAVGSLPANSEADFPSASVAKIAKEVFGDTTAPAACANANGGVGIYLPPGEEQKVTSALDAVLGHDVTVADRQSPIRATHRRIDGKEVFFVINDSDKAWAGDLTLAAAGQGEAIDPQTGESRKIDGPDKVVVKLDPYSAVILRFGEPRKPHRLRPNAAP